MLELGRTLSASVRVAIVADVAVYRDALSALIAEERSITLVGAVSTLSQALEIIRSEQPAVVVVDMASSSGLRWVKGIRTAAPDVKVVAFAVGEDDEAVLQCAEVGVSGFITREADSRQVVSAIELAARGELLCSPRTAAVLFERVGAMARHRALPTPLTERERQIATLLAEGLSNKEIAVALRIEVPTVKNHVHRILSKLRVCSRAEAAASLVARLPR